MIPKFKKISTTSRKPANVTAIRYDPITRDLDVTFHHGRSYRYQDVPKDVAIGLEHAPSQGTYLHKHIIGSHDVTEITDK